MNINNFKKIVSEKIHDNFSSHIINHKNQEVFKSYKKIIHNSSKKNNTFKKLLIDVGFYNLGYFYRLQLLRAAINSNELEEHAYIWDRNFNLCKNLLNCLDIEKFSHLKISHNKEILFNAERLGSSIKQKEDILNLDLPYNVPGSFLYDVILKIQRLPSVDLEDKNLKKYIYKFLYSINFSHELLENFKPDILAMSHCISYQCAPIAWLSAQKNIPVIVLGGDFGITRFWKFTKPKDIFIGFAHPKNKDLQSLTKEKKEKIVKIGEKYIYDRISGQTADISGRYAFQRKKGSFEQIGIKVKNKTIIAIYSNTFYDYPHTFGMSRFLDVKDWILSTIKQAGKNKEVIWLIKPHPLEQWYGGITLKDILPKNLPENVKVLSHDYSGKDIIENVDALVTLHGTGAIEFAAIGKPVLVADVGWYHNCGFVKFPKSRDDYLRLLNEPWYHSLDLKKTKLKAKLFAGMFFGIPTWQKSTLIPDDADTEELRLKLPKLIEENKNALNNEIKLLRKWIKSDMSCFNTFKMSIYNNFATLTKQ